MLTPYDDIVAAASAEYGVPISWIDAVMGTESGSLSDFTIPSNVAPTYEASVDDYSYGPMQIRYQTAQGLGYTGAETDLSDPSVSIPLAVEDIAQIVSGNGLDFTNDSFDPMYSAYNSGKTQNYLSNAQVGANVARAEQWLAYFQSQGADSGAGTGGGGLLSMSGDVLAFVVILVGWWHMNKGRR